MRRLISKAGDVQPALPVAPTARRRNDTLWGGLATAVAVAAMLWIAYQSNVRYEVTQVQKQIASQHDESGAELQSLKDQIQRLTAAQSRTDAEVARLVKHRRLPKVKFKGFKTTSMLLARSEKRKKMRSVDHSLILSSEAQPSARIGPLAAATGFGRSVTAPAAQPRATPSSHADL
jgi:hypothetical protein